LEYTFIVGLGGTGTKMMMNVLNMHARLNISDDMHFLAPRWLRVDLARRAKRLGSLRDDSTVRLLVELMYSRVFEGNFWQRDTGIHRLDRDRLTRRVLDSDRSLKSLLGLLIEEDAHSRGKVLAGSRLPVNISCLPTLLEWFPEARIIHLVRDPRAIHMSRIKKDMHGSSIPASICHLKRMPFTWHQMRTSARVHALLGHRINYHLVRFEDAVSAPHETIESLCEFLGVEFDDSMLKPPVDSTAYESTRSVGFDPVTAHRWREHIPPLVRRSLEWSLRREMESVGYSAR
jgi:Sulfotransferase family